MVFLQNRGDRLVVQITPCLPNNAFRVTDEELELREWVLHLHLGGCPGVLGSLGMVVDSTASLRDQVDCRIVVV